MLQVIEIFFEENINPDNCFRIRDIAIAFSLEKVEAATESCILNNFEKLSKNFGFTQLHKDELVEIISSDDLRVSRESIWTFAAVVNFTIFLACGEKSILKFEVTNFRKIRPVAHLRFSKTIVKLKGQGV